MHKDIAIYLKKISFYEQKLQTLKQTLFSNNINNIRRAFNQISNNVIDKNQLMNFFVQNIQPIGHKDIALLLQIIGDPDNSKINYLQFENYIFRLLYAEKIRPIMNDETNLTMLLIKLFQYQIKIHTELKEDRLSLIGSHRFNINDIFEDLSYDGKLRWDRIDQFMKNNLVKFTKIDYDYFMFASFDSLEVDLNTFKKSLFFQDYENKPHYIPVIIPSSKYEEVKQQQIHFPPPILMRTSQISDKSQKSKKKVYIETTLQQNDQI